MNTGPAIQVQGLSKAFGEIKAVKSISFSVRQGEIFSLLGPNGAGKSTTISMLACLLRPSGGDALVMSHSIIREPAAVKARIGVVPQEIALYSDLSARENLLFWGKMYGLRGDQLKERADEALEVTGLADRQKGRVATFSGGMKRRLNIGIALLHRPPILILDEPTVGIDPQSRRHILEGIKALNRQGMTVLYTTHYMEEAQELSDQIAIMDQGEIIACGTYLELITVVGQWSQIEIGLQREDSNIIECWRSMSGVHGVDAINGKISVFVEDSNRQLPDLFEAANRQGVRISSVDIREPNLEAVFLHLTGRALRD